MMADFDLGTVATHSCLEGFFLDGVMIRTCIDNNGAEWSGSPPLCRREYSVWN